MVKRPLPHQNPSVAKRKLLIRRLVASPKPRHAHLAGLAGGVHVWGGAPHQPKTRENPAISVSLTSKTNSKSVILGDSKDNYEELH